MSSPTVSENEIADQIGFSAYFDVVYILGASLFYGTWYINVIDDTSTYDLCFLYWQVSLYLFSHFQSMS